MGNTRYLPNPYGPPPHLAYSATSSTPLALSSTPPVTDHVLGVADSVVNSTIPVAILGAVAGAALYKNRKKIVRAAGKVSGYASSFVSRLAWGSKNTDPADIPRL